MTKMNQAFRRMIRENAPRVIMAGGICISLLAIAACALNGQRKDKGVGRMSNAPIVETKVVDKPKKTKQSLEPMVHEFVYDGNSYLLIEWGKGIAVTKK